MSVEWAASRGQPRPTLAINSGGHDERKLRSTGLTIGAHRPNGLDAGEFDQSWPCFDQFGARRHQSWAEFNHSWAEFGQSVLRFRPIWTEFGHTWCGLAQHIANGWAWRARTDKPAHRFSDMFGHVNRCLGISFLCLPLFVSLCTSSSSGGRPEAPTFDRCWSKWARF